MNAAFHANILEALALQYLARPTLPTSGECIAALNSFIQWRADCVYRTMPHGFVAVYVPEDNPYPSGEAMMNAVNNENMIRVSTTNNSSPVFTPKNNVLGRMAHDIFDHVKLDNGFSVQCEVRATMNVLQDFEFWCELCDQGLLPARGPLSAPSDALYTECVNVLLCEYALQPIAADWLGGYDSARGGFTFSQRVVDASDLYALVVALQP